MIAPIDPLSTPQEIMNEMVEDIRANLSGDRTGGVDLLCHAIVVRRRGGAVTDCPFDVEQEKTLFARWVWAFNGFPGGDRRRRTKPVSRPIWKTQIDPADTDDIDVFAGEG